MRTHLGTIGTVARRAGTVATGLAGRVQREVTLRWSSSRRGAPPSTIAPPGPEVAPEVERATEPHPPTPSPLQVARAVAVNAANLTRTNPSLPRPRRRSVPGAKLPARAGRGIIGV